MQSNQEQQFEHEKIFLQTEEDGGRLETKMSENEILFSGQKNQGKYGSQTGNLITWGDNSEIEIDQMVILSNEAHVQLKKEESNHASVGNFPAVTFKKSTKANKSPSEGGAITAIGNGGVPQSAKSGPDSSERTPVASISLDEPKIYSKRTTFGQSQTLSRASTFGIGNSFLNKTKNVKRFIQNLRKTTQGYLIQSLTPMIFTLIDDKSSDLNTFLRARATKFGATQMSSVQKFLIRALDTIMKALQSEWGIFHPENPGIMIWEILLTIYIISQIILQPLRDALPSQFKDDEGEYKLLSVHEEIIPIIVFIVDTLLLFNTAIFKRGLLIKDRHYIFKVQFKESFIVELIVIVLYYVGVYNTEYSWLQYSILLKFKDYLRLYQKYSEIFDHNREQIIYTQSAKIISQILILAHISACIFITVANASSPRITWIDKLIEVTKITEPSVSEIYTTALYWSIITMVTLGYGDIVPISQHEKLFVICVAFVSCGLFSYSFNLIGEIINESRREKMKLKLEMENLNNLMEDRGLNLELKNKVRKYFAYLHKEKQKNVELASEMISGLPESLKDDVMKDLYSKFLRQIPIFKNKFSDEFIYDLSLSVSEEKYGPEVSILAKNSVPSRLNFILNGEVTLYQDTKRPFNSTIAEQGIKGTALGLKEFLTQTPIEYHVKSDGVSSIGYFTYDQFIDKLTLHPKDYETYFGLKDQMQIYQLTKGLGIQCQVCKNSFHPMEDCHLIRYQANIPKLMLNQKKLEQVLQDRCKDDTVKPRRTTGKYNSVLQQPFSEDEADKLINDIVLEVPDSSEELGFTLRLLQSQADTMNFRFGRRRSNSYSSSDEDHRSERNESVADLAVITNNRHYHPTSIKTIPINEQAGQHAQVFSQQQQNFVSHFGQTQYFQQYQQLLLQQQQGQPHSQFKQSPMKKGTLERNESKKLRNMMAQQDSLIEDSYNNSSNNIHSNQNSTQLPQGRMRMQRQNMAERLTGVTQHNQSQSSMTSILQQSTSLRNKLVGEEGELSNEHTMYLQMHQHQPQQLLQQQQIDLRPYNNWEITQQQQHQSQQQQQGQHPSMMSKLYRARNSEVINNLDFSAGIPAESQNTIRQHQDGIDSMQFGDDQAGNNQRRKSAGTNTSKMLQFNANAPTTNNNNNNNQYEHAHAHTHAHQHAADQPGQLAPGGNNALHTGGYFPYIEEDDEEDDGMPFMPIKNFDRFKNFMIYFPHNNLRTIIRNIEEKRSLMIQHSRTSKVGKKGLDKSKGTLMMGKSVAQRSIAETQKSKIPIYKSSG